MAMAHLRMIVAGEVTGARENLPFIMELALRANEEVAAKLPTEQNRELKQIARGRQDVKQIEAQLRQPDQSLIPRVVRDRRKKYKPRAEKGEQEQPYDRYKDQMRKGRNGSGWEPGGRNRYSKGRDPERSRD